MLVTVVAAGSLLSGGGWAEKPASEGAAPTVGQASVQQAAPETIDAQKLEVAKDLTDWLNHTLQEKKALVAVVGRQGSPQTKKQDKTGMGHAGLAVYDPRAQSWIVYNLLNNIKPGQPPMADIWRSAPLDFFYGQQGYEKNALILIPDEETQQRMYEAILTDKYKSLLFTRNYNLLSAPNSRSSLNCNKWLLMNVVAARIDNYDPATVLNTIRDGFDAGTITLNPIEKMGARHKSSVRASEMPRHGAIQTVTVESLYRSDLFSDKIFRSGQSL